MKHFMNASNYLKIFVAEKNTDIVLIQDPKTKSSTVKGVNVKNYKLE